MSGVRGYIKDRLDPVSSRQKSRPTRSGLILLGLIALFIYMALAHDIPIINGKPGDRLRADFAFANQVDNKTPVRVNGVPVGIVDKVGPGSDPLRSSRVEMRITDEDLVIHKDATAEIRWRTLVGGNMYIDLHPGSEREPALGDDVIAVDRTENQTEIDDALTVYEGNSDEAQRDIIRGLSDGLGDDKVLKSAINSLPKFEDVGEGVEPLLGTEVGDLHKLIGATATTVQALGADTTALQNLVTGARTTLGATNTRRAELGAFLEESAPTLQETSLTMRRLQTTLDHLDPLVSDLRPGARELAGAANAAKPALAEADGLLKDLRPLLTDLRPTFGDLSATANSAVPVINGLNPTINRLNSEILPWLGEKDDELNNENYKAIGPFFSVLNMAAAEFDAIGYRLHLSTPAASNSVITAQLLQFQRRCMETAPDTPEARIGCKRAAQVQAYGWFGDGKAKK